MCCIVSIFQDKSNDLQRQVNALQRELVAYKDCEDSRNAVEEYEQQLRSVCDYLLLFK